MDSIGVEGKNFDEWPVTNARCGTYIYQSWVIELGGVGVMQVFGDHTFVLLADDHSLYV